MLVSMGTVLWVIGLKPVIHGQVSKSYSEMNVITLDAPFLEDIV